MGELLRAVCDANAIDSAPAFYTSRLNLDLTGPSPAVTFGDRSTFLQLKSDVWFLLMGWTQSTTQSAPVATPGIWDTRSAATGFTLRDVKTGRRYSELSSVKKVNQNFNLNSFVTLPEYVLFEPDTLIEVIQNVRTAITNPFTANFQSIVTMAGIEYRFPDRPGGWKNGKARP